MKYGPFLVSLMIFLLYCSSDRNTDAGFENCRYAKPEAIFSESLAEVEEHSFKIRKKEGIEQLRFKSGKELTIIQSGCDSIRQEFQFNLPGSFPKGDAEYWVAKAVEEFQQLGAMGPQYMMFSSWAQAIAAQAEHIQLTESNEIQPGFFVRIDRVLSQGDANLLVTLSETP